MRWFARGHNKEDKKLPRDTAALDAIDRARDAAHTADSELETMKRSAEYFRAERRRNHFAPAIFASMRGRRDDA